MRPQFRLFARRLLARRLLAVLSFAFVPAAFCPFLFADEFAFKYQAGDKFKIISEVQEEYLQNGKLMDKSLIHNRISTEVTGITGGKALHKGVFQVMVEKTAADGGKTLNITNEYTSQFERDTRGKMAVNRRYAFPSVRNVPVLPEGNIRAGDMWQEKGEEVHDMQMNFGIKDFLRLPFNAQYKYEGEQTWRNKKYPAFLVTYKIRQQLNDYFEKSPRTFMQPNNQRDVVKDVQKEIVITSISGETTQTIFWDMEMGQPAASRGSFNLRFTMSDGTVHEFRSREEAEIIYSEQMNKDEVLADVQKVLDSEGLRDASVRKVEGGVSISIENIEFESDSAVLRASEKAKLDKIAGVLTRYAGRDILVTGHTADVGGTSQSHITLSEERAGAVAGYLTQKKVRPSGRIMTKGYGASMPLADNKTPEGRQKNRRVEIVILEN